MDKLAVKIKELNLSYREGRIMIILDNVNLQKYSMMNIGGKAIKVYVPENINELINLLNNELNTKKYYKIAFGSNILISDKLIVENLIDLREFNKEINLSEDIVTIGASVRLQKAIVDINKLGYGGIEYLFSVPGSIGGAIYMNAGRGANHKKSISDFVESVTIYDGYNIRMLSNKECNFKYRSSTFHEHNNWTIIEATFKFDKGAPDEFRRKRKERIEFARKYQDNRNGNLGSIFKTCNPYIMTVLKTFRVGWNNIHYSGKTCNWIVNENNDSFVKVKHLINICRALHILLFQKYKLEIEIWE